MTKQKLTWFILGGALLWSSSFLFLSVSQAASDKQFETRKNYFYNLEPGITLHQIHETIGLPDTSYEGKPAYKLDTGVAVLEFKDDMLMRCRHYRPDQWAEFSELYILSGERLTEAEYKTRELLLKSPEFYNPGKWTGQQIYTRRYPGITYLLQDGYIVFEGEGTLRDQLYASKITRFYGQKPLKIFWRLFEHWLEIRPTDLSDEQISNRERVLREYGAKLKSSQNLLSLLGEPDAKFGSGILQYQYYISAGLITIIVAPPSENITLSQPGADRQLSFDQWLKK